MDTNITIDSPNADLINNGSIISDKDLNLNLASLTNITNSNASKAEIITVPEFKKLDLGFNNSEIASLGTMAPVTAVMVAGGWTAVGTGTAREREQQLQPQQLLPPTLQ